MVMMKSMRYRHLLWSLTFTLSACFSAELPPLSAPSGLAKLRRLSDQTIPLTITTQGAESTRRGFQYLFVVVPFSRVYTPHIREDLELQLSVAAGLRGYNLSTSKVDDRSAERLEVSISSLEVNGYDLLILRKPTSSTALKGTLYRGEEMLRSCEVSEVASANAAYAFAGELQSAESEALLAASNKLLDCLGLTR